MPDTIRLAYLFNKYTNNSCSPEEQEELWALLRAFSGQQDLLLPEMLALWDKVRTGEQASDSVNWTLVGHRMQLEIRQSQQKDVAIEKPRIRLRRVYTTRRWLVAAGLLLLMAAGAFYWLNSRNSKLVPVVNATIDIAPGKEGAILTLADGTRLVLDTMQAGVVAIQNGTQVLLQNGQVKYDAANLSGAPQYNTMSTPRGRQFQLLLPDGTRVWLNAASSITYPTFFAGTERRVRVTGEVYFEVAKNQKLPFRVEVNNQATIEVLGTHFNVNAYNNEATMKTTLLEGSVLFTPAAKGHRAVVLKPAQQAELSSGAPPRIHDNADIDKVMAWKNGLFNFDKVPITEVMKQVERWYDITVVYEKGVPDIEFFGELSRNISLNDLIDALKDVGVRFRIEEGRKLVVLP
jgi:Fe2+-dicitrate sensor, membrane component